jgi:hypothetical protein
VGKKLAKEIYSEYGSLGDFVVNFKDTSEEVVNVKPKSVTYKKITGFLEQIWNPKVEREVIFVAEANEPRLEFDPEGLEDIEDVGEQETLF